MQNGQWPSFVLYTPVLMFVNFWTLFERATFLLKWARFINFLNFLKYILKTFMVTLILGDMFRDVSEEGGV